LIDNVSKGNLPSVECIIHFFVVVCCVVEGKVEGEIIGNDHAS